MTILSHQYDSVFNQTIIHVLYEYNGYALDYHIAMSGQPTEFEMTQYATADFEKWKTRL